MPRELITVQIGQCGLQVGTKFWSELQRWNAQLNVATRGRIAIRRGISPPRIVHPACSRCRDLALREHAAYNRSGLFDEPLSSFFRNVDSRFNPPLELPVTDRATGKLNPIATLKARAVLVDMEEGVLNELCRGSLADLFDDKQLIKDVSGSGNNFAHGHFGQFNIE
jgi:tubulin epsilon